MKNNNKNNNKEEPNWKYMCYRVIGRMRRLERFKQTLNSDFLNQKQMELIVKAFREMENACLEDSEYQWWWER